MELSSPEIEGKHMIDPHIGDINLIHFSVGFSILAIWLWVEPYKRDFSCIDKIFSAYSIRDSTIKTWMLFLIGAIPVVMVSQNCRITYRLNERHL